MESGIGTNTADLGRELKRWVRQGPRGPSKVSALASRIGVSQSTLYAYLAGATVPPADVLDELLQALDLPPREQRRLATARDCAQRTRRATSPSDTSRVPALPVPRELPAEPTGFTGRAEALESLDDTLRHDTPVPVSLISGPAGVGKTALALRWGHRVGDRFPDGCLYRDLRGYSVDEPVPPREALAAFLRSLGVPEGELPPGCDERAARFRSLTAGKQILVVLDNAFDVDQVRPLLPGGTGCLALVTSRAALTGLHVRPGADQLTLAPLPVGAALDLLHAQLPEHASTAAIRDLAEPCGGLPLALRVVAAQARGLSPRGVEGLVHDLTGRGDLDRFEIGDEESSLRRVFSWSEHRLPPKASEAFRLLGVPPVQDLGLAAAAALFGCGVTQARARLGTLAQAHLVSTTPGPRYGMHDLLRQHAQELAVEEVPENDGRAAITRLVDHLVGLGTHAVNVLHPPESNADTPAASAASAAFPGPADAQAWLDREWANLMALTACAEQRDLPRLARDLVSVLRPHLDQGGRHRDALTVLAHSLAVDRRLGDQASEGATLRDLGTASMRVGQHRAGMDHFRASLSLAREANDRNGEAGTLNNLGNLHERLGNYDEAIEHYRLAVPIAVELSYRKGEATLHNNLGCVWLQRGDHDLARREFECALGIFVEIGDIGGSARARGNLGQAQLGLGLVADSTASLEESLEEARAVGATGIETESLNGLGVTLRTSGHPDRALEAHESALTMARESGDRYEEARALEGIGHGRLQTGDGDNARSAWLDAWSVFLELELDEAARVARILDGTEPTQATP
ncbi:MAG: tetratricopeptide repeat protein [Nocardioides sp.]|nr:tetratricopeptide repeat protein [Nocardioides sp.]